MIDISVNIDRHRLDRHRRIVAGVHPDDPRLAIVSVRETYSSDEYVSMPLHADADELGELIAALTVLHSQIEEAGS